jgi:DNA-binding transcriptional MocR family regulator
MSMGFREVARLLREQIVDGDYAPGASLPSEKDVAKDFGCSRDTIRDAMAILSNEGLIITRRGHLTQVRPKLTPILVELPPNAQVTARAMTLDESEMIDCGRGVPMLEVHIPGADIQLYRADMFILTTATVEATQSQAADRNSS